MLSLHAVGMAVSVGLLVALDLRLLGLFEVVSFSFLRRALALAWMGFMINFLSGTALFFPRGVEYVRDPAFLSKIALILLGVATTGYLQGVLNRESDDWSPDAGAPVKMRFWAVASIVMWFGALMSGRLIAYIESF